MKQADWLWLCTSTPAGGNATFITILSTEGCAPFPSWHTLMHLPWHPPPSSVYFPCVYEAAWPLHNHYRGSSRPSTLFVETLARNVLPHRMPSTCGRISYRWEWHLLRGVSLRCSVPRVFPHSQPLNTSASAVRFGFLTFINEHNLHILDGHEISTRPLQCFALPSWNLLLDCSASKLSYGRVKVANRSEEKGLIIWI